MVAIPPDGRITSLTALGAPLTGTEVMYIVSPGNAAAGVSFQILTNTLAAFNAGFPALNFSSFTTGATYNAKTTDTRIFIIKSVGSATSVVMPLAATMIYPSSILIKDLKGDAAANNITISFTAGEKIDNASTLVINTNFGYARIAPTPATLVSAGASAWYVET